MITLHILLALLCTLACLALFAGLSAFAQVLQQIDAQAEREDAAMLDFLDRR